MLARATSTTVSGLSEVCPTIIKSPGLKAPQVEAEGAGVPPTVGFVVGLLVVAPVGLGDLLGVGFGVGLGVGVGVGVATTTLKSDESCDTCVRSMKLFDEIQLLASLIRPCSVATLPVQYVHTDQVARKRRDRRRCHRRRIDPAAGAPCDAVNEAERRVGALFVE
eukprot:1589481-Prorocentrum_lima.AAC.1